MRRVACLFPALVCVALLVCTVSLLGFKALEKISRICEVTHKIAPVSKHQQGFMGDVMPSWCPETYQLEKHEREPDHGDVCRKSDNSFTCPGLCRAKERAPYCQDGLSTMPCRTVGDPPVRDFFVEPYANSFLLPVDPPQGGYSLSDVGVVIRTYWRDAELAALAALGAISALPDSISEISVVAPQTDIASIENELKLKLRHVDEVVLQTGCIWKKEALKRVVRAVPVGCNVYGGGSHPYWGWDARQQLAYDALHTDLYSSSRVILYMESDVMFNRKVELGDLINPLSRLPYLRYGTVAFLCRQEFANANQTSTMSARLCDTHRRTAAAAGTLFGVFSTLDMELQGLPALFPREMFPAARDRIAEVHMDMDSVFDYFTRHGYHQLSVCRGAGNSPEQAPWLWQQDDWRSRFQRRVAETPALMVQPSCEAGISKPHSLGTFAFFFMRRLFHAVSIMNSWPRIAVQLVSHNVRNKSTGRLCARIATILVQGYRSKQFGEINEMNLHC